MEKVMMQLGTLTCPSCLQKIETAVGNAKGVKSVKVMFNASKVKAEIDSSETNEDALKDLIEKLGYEVKSVKVKAI